MLFAFAEEKKNFPVFANSVQRKDLLSVPRISAVENRHSTAAALVGELERKIGAQPLSYWKTLLDSASLPYDAVQIPEEIVQDPQLHANKIIVPIANGGGERKFTVDSPFTIEEQSK